MRVDTRADVDPRAANDQRTGGWLVLLAPKKGFVFLAMTKSASTAIESAFAPHSDIVFQTNPFKHTTYEGFTRALQPYLEDKGFGRSDYEVVCVFRDPMDWLLSWWRFRSRKQLRKRAPEKWAGDIGSDEFAQTYMAFHRREVDAQDKRFAQLVRPMEFVREIPGSPPMDKVFRYDSIGALVDHLSNKVGKRVEVGIENTSPERAGAWSPQVEAELRDFFAPEFEIYENATR